jgi:adenosylhomocysteine nucleosidase
MAPADRSVSPAGIPHPHSPHARKARIVIFAALFSEAVAIARHLRIPPPSKNNITQRDDLAMALIGPGACLLPGLPPIEAEGYIVAGLAGALDPRLEIADVVVDGVNTPHFRAPGEFMLHFGGLHTATQLVASPADKAALFSRTGALAVDMETDLIRTLAQRRGIPFLALRAISDAAGETLDPAILKFIDASGRTKPWRAARHLMAHPAKTPAILRLGRNTRCALSHLTLAIDALLASNWPAG